MSCRAVPGVLRSVVMRGRGLKDWGRFANLLGLAAAGVRVSCSRWRRVLALRGNVLGPGLGQRPGIWAMWL